MPNKKVRKRESNDHIQLRLLREAAERSGGSFIAFYVNEDGNHVIYKELGQNNNALGMIKFVQTWANIVADVQENAIANSLMPDDRSTPPDGQEA